MKINLTQLTVRDVYEGYVDSDDDGAFGYGGMLNIRPKYQREFVYEDELRNAVLDTVKKHFPLNVMYWVKVGKDSYELLDGQQRTLSICQYVKGDFSINDLYFHNLTHVEQNSILDYKLMIYICEGNDKEKLEWFETINIAGLKLTPQELRNAVYTGEWLTDAKKYFSKRGCPAHSLANKYMKGDPRRQEYLETAIKWINDGKIKEYMSIHQHDKNALELWLYFKTVINWVEALFPKNRKEMNKVNWGALYNQYKDATFDPNELELNLTKLMQDEDVTKKAGIYPYLLSGEEKHLSIRAFTPNMKREAYERQGGICSKCNGHFGNINEMEGDHITPWHEGGKTISANCQMLCKDCNRKKSGK